MIGAEVKNKRAATLKLLTDLSVSATDYARINEYALWPDEDAYDASFEASINELRLFRVTQCNPILLNVTQAFRRPKDIAKSFLIVANFSFRYFIIGNQSPGNLERVSNTIAVKIRKGKVTKPKELAEELQAISPDATFRADFSLVEFSKARARIARYTLAKLNNHLSKNANGAEQVTNPDAKQVNLEHVLPQNPTQIWRAGFEKQVAPEDYIYKLGNLTLLTNKVNRDVADKSFADKKKEAFSKSALVLNQTVRRFSKWSNVEIEKRQQELAKVALELWNL